MPIPTDPDRTARRGELLDPVRTRVHDDADGRDVPPRGGDEPSPRAADVERAVERGRRIELDDVPASRRIDRWTWCFGLAAVLVATGIATTTPALVAAGVVPLALVAYGGLVGLPEPSLTASRSLDLDPTAPGDPVEIELTVTNDGDQPVHDVRVVDLVPRATPVRSGSPRAAFRLDPGESRTITYTVGARRGVHEFDGVSVRVRNVPGSAVADRTLTADGDRRLECELPLRDPPAADQTRQSVGAVSADEQGEGVEFYAVREYRRGDDVTDVDWRRYARTGELTTVRYRQERAATYVVVIDARDDAYVSGDPELPSAARLSAFAAGRAFDVLGSTHHEVGLAVVFPSETVYVEPGTDAATFARARDALERIDRRDPLGTTRSAEYVRTSAVARLHDLERRIPGRAQVVFVSPTTDVFGERVVRGLRSHGYPVTVLVPDVLTADEPAQTVLGAERDRRLLDLRAAGARVVEWDRDDALPLVLERTLRRGRTAASGHGGTAWSGGGRS